jgi:small subunit ribosomal protein S8
MQEGFIRNFKIVKDDKQDVICVYLKYQHDNSPVITHLERVSKPGRRAYVKAKNIPSVRSGLGVAILSTSSGVMTGRQAQALHLGGEHICSIW